ncbi:MAG: hypothetical protein IPG28_20360 [Betaproteobacteria bacterium]|nr:hypothetical protein [Betaproteobacteria bacterium]
MSFKPYQGQGPSSVAQPPDAYRNQANRDVSEPTLDGDHRAIIQDRLANDRFVRGGEVAPSRGVPSSDDLRRKVNEGVAGVESKLDANARRATTSRNQLGQALNDATENVSATHGLGDQPDGRSARQQMERKPPEKTGGGSGEW